MAKMSCAVKAAFVCLFLGWFVTASWYNVFVGDDYWHALRVYDHGFWGSQLFYWRTWEGAYVHGFLATIPAALRIPLWPFLTSVVAWLLLVVSIHNFLKEYVRHPPSCTAKTGEWLTALLIGCFIYLFTGGGAEIRFWACATTYTLGVACLLAFLAHYHHAEDWRGRGWGWALFLLCMLVGNKISFIAWTFVAMMTHDIATSKLSRSRASVYCVLMVLSLMNVLAPGNLIRLQGNVEGNPFSWMRLMDAVVFRAGQIVPILMATVMLFPLCEFRVPKKVIAIVAYSFIVTFVVDTAIMYLSFHDPGPLRCLIIPETHLVFLVILLMGWIRSRFNLGERTPSYLLFCVLVGIGYCLKNADEYAKLPETIAFSNGQHERDEYVRNSGETGIVRIRPLPDAGLLLPYFVNEEVWLENVYLPYFHKTNQVKLTLLNSIEDDRTNPKERGRGISD